MGFDSIRNVYGFKKKILNGREHTGEENAFLPVATLFGYEYIIRKIEKLISSSSKWHPL